MGLQVAHDPEKPSAEGEMPLSTAPFETLKDPVRVDCARFYTLGYKGLKFYRPHAFFSLPSVDVSHCESRSDVESLLRQTWTAHVKELRRAREWLEQLGAKPELASKATQLLLPLSGVEGPAARVLSPSEIQLPSSGPLAEISLEAPSDRRHRPSPGLQHSSDLEMEVCAAMSNCDRRTRSRRHGATGPGESSSDPHPAPRILVLDPNPAALAATEALLGIHGYTLNTFQSPERALGAFNFHSYELVLVASSMPRLDGLEFVSMVRRLPGMQNLPAALINARVSTHQKTQAMSLGVAACFDKPLSWAEVGPTLVDALEHPRTRRFQRVPARLQVETALEKRSTMPELAEEIGRRGFRLRTTRELFPDVTEHYRITLPEPLEPIRVEGKIVSRLTIPGDASILAGVHILSFLEGNESDWIQLIDARLQQGSEKRATPETDG
jgi:CheY-like chemotaxis protein